MRWIDITHPLSNDSACWPGDTAYRLELTWRIAAGAPVNVSRVELSPHNGTHADAPFHYDQKGLTMDQVELDRYVGRARVVRFSGHTSISASDLGAIDLTGVSRLLIATDSCPNPQLFYPGFTYLEDGAAKYLASQGIRLVGTDAHSVDPAESKDLPAHHACMAAGILILENLNLRDVAPGDYELIALPLRLAGADGSPVRAVLRTVD